jgi:AcrR family transcriptional regulator
LSTPDWLVGGDRRARAVERIHIAAAELIARNGLEALSIDKVAARVGCSRATVYRYVGGKAILRDGVLSRAAARVADTVQKAVAPLDGSERVVAAITASVAAVRADGVALAFLTHARSEDVDAYLAQSPQLAHIAAALTGLTDDDADATRWIVRIVLSLLFWPAGDPDTERKLIERFVVPAFT